MSEQAIYDHADKIGKSLNILMPDIVGNKEDFPVYTGEHENSIIKINVVSDTLDDTHGADSLISALHKARIDYAFIPAKQEHNGGSFLTIDTQQDGFAEKWDALVAEFYTQTAARITGSAQAEMDKLSLLHQTTTHNPSTLNPEEHITPIFIDISWKNALAHLKTLPPEQQAGLLQSMHTKLAQSAGELRDQVTNSSMNHAEKLALLKPLANINSNQRDK